MTKAFTYFTERSVRQPLRGLVALLLFPLLFTACMDDPAEVIAPEAEAAVPQIIKLAPAPAKWVNLEGSSVELEPTIDPKLDDKQRRAPRYGGNDRGRFNIDLKFLVPVTDAQREVFDVAAGRWEQIIIKDVPSFTGTLPSAFEGFPPAVEGTLDDIVIEVVLAPIDGPGNILGQAGPRFVRTSDFLTISGVMFFDVDDLAALDELDLFEEVILHEMGHVLGVGTLWNIGERTLRLDEETNPYFAGRTANFFWNVEGGTFKLPVEDMGGPGTRLSHWRESVLRNELMTGFLNLGENPLSRITAGSMRDLGYGAVPVGERYDLPRGTPGVDPNATPEPDTLAPAPGTGINIAAREILLEPIGSVTIK